MHAIFTAGIAPAMPLPLVLSSVPAGFPSPAESYIERSLDLNTLLIRHPAATFFVRADGDSMIGAGINSGDLLVVDRAVEPHDGAVVIACLDGDLTVKRLHLRGTAVTLCPENPDYEPVTIAEDGSLLIWGVVTTVIHPL